MTTLHDNDTDIFSFFPVAVIHYNNVLHLLHDKTGMTPWEEREVTTLWPWDVVNPEEAERTMAPKYYGAKLN